MNLVNKAELSAALLYGAPLRATDRITLKTVNAVQREDGSNKSFNVTGFTASGEAKTVHVRTRD